MLISNININLILIDYYYLYPFIIVLNLCHLSIIDHNVNLIIILSASARIDIA